MFGENRVVIARILINYTPMCVKGEKLYAFFFFYSSGSNIVYISKSIVINNHMCCYGKPFVYTGYTDFGFAWCYVSERRENERE